MNRKTRPPGEKVFPPKEVATAQGLVDTDEEYISALEEATTLKTAHACRVFFAHLLLVCKLDKSKAPGLWSQFEENFIDDYLLETRDCDIAKDRALAHIQSVLEHANGQLSDFNLPLPRDFDPQAFRLKELRAALDYDSAVERAASQDKRQKMRDDQAAAFDAITQSIDKQEGRLFFIDGPGGSGKTFLEEALLHHVRGQKNIAAACAWSGVAATLLPGGKTCHSTFGLPVPLPKEDVQSNIAGQSGRAEFLRQAILLIWDEAPMSPSEAVDAADQLLRFVTGVNDRPFGGKTVVFAGDFRQVLPVITRAERPEIVAHSLRHHKYWTQNLIETFVLRGNQRATETDDALYAEYLLRVGDGTEPVYALGDSNVVRIPDDIAAPKGWAIGNLIEHTYPDLLSATQRCTAPGVRDEDYKFLAERASLSNDFLLKFHLVSFLNYQ